MKVLWSIFISLQHIEMNVSSHHHKSTSGLPVYSEMHVNGKHDGTRVADICIFFVALSEYCNYEVIKILTLIQKSIWQHVIKSNVQNAINTTNQNKRHSRKQMLKKLTAQLNVTSLSCGNFHLGVFCAHCVWRAALTCCAEVCDGSCFLMWCAGSFSNSSPARKISYCVHNTSISVFIFSINIAAQCL